MQGVYCFLLLPVASHCFPLVYRRSKYTPRRKLLPSLAVSRRLPLHTTRLSLLPNPHPQAFDLTPTKELTPKQLKLVQGTLTVNLTRHTPSQAWRVDAAAPDIYGASNFLPFGGDPTKALVYPDTPNLMMSTLWNRDLGEWLGSILLRLSITSYYFLLIPITLSVSCSCREDAPPIIPAPNYARLFPI